MPSLHLGGLNGQPRTVTVWETPQSLPHGPSRALGGYSPAIPAATLSGSTQRPQNQRKPNTHPSKPSVRPPSMRLIQMRGVGCRLGDLCNHPSTSENR